MNQGTFGNPVNAPCPEPGAAKAWVIFKGAATQAGVVILSSYNVASVRRDGSGLYTVTFQRPFGSPAFVYMINGKAAPTAAFIGYAPPTDLSAAGAKQVQVISINGAAYDPPECCFSAWGAQ